MKDHMCMYSCVHICIHMCLCTYMCMYVYIICYGLAGHSPLQALRTMQTHTNIQFANSLIHADTG
jgi:hypothetical protein